MGSLSPLLLFCSLLLLIGSLPMSSTSSSSVWHDGESNEMSATERAAWRESAREMFEHAFCAYWEHAYPADELRPLSCTPRTRATSNLGDLDAVLGDYMLTLVDALDVLAVLGDREAFARGVADVSALLRLDADWEVSVFECNIRMLGGLLSAHLLAADRVSALVHSAHPLHPRALLARDARLAAVATPPPADMTDTGAVREAVSSPSRATCSAAFGCYYDVEGEEEALVVVDEEEEHTGEQTEEQHAHGAGHSLEEDAIHSATKRAKSTSAWSSADALRPDAHYPTHFQHIWQEWLRFSGTPRSTPIPQRRCSCIRRGEPAREGESVESARADCLKHHTSSPAEADWTERLVLPGQVVGSALKQYNGELLELALELGTRLLPAFDTPTGRSPR
jgi:Glycosyl hydrolase family 47